MGFTNTEPQNHESENIWFTPKHLIEALGPFDLDPCTVSFRPFHTAKKHYEYDLGDNGLELPWIGDVWLNPPYGKQIIPFIEKFLEHRKGIMLIFARMGSEGVQQLLKGGALCFCLRKRVFFIQKHGLKSTNSGTDSILVFFDEKYIEKCMVMEGVFIKGFNHERNQQ
jgi:hypothetical protein